MALVTQGSSMLRPKMRTENSGKLRDRLIQGLNRVQSGGVHAKMAGGALPWMSLKKLSQISLLLHAELPHRFLILNSNRWQWGVRNVWSMHCSHCSRSSSNQQLGEYLGWGLHLTFVLDWHNWLYLPASLFLLPLQDFFTTSTTQSCTFLPFICVKFSANNALHSETLYYKLQWIIVLYSPLLTIWHHPQSSLLGVESLVYSVFSAIETVSYFWLTRSATFHVLLSLQNLFLI